MSDPETRALGRAAVLLLVASLARWGWEAGRRQDAPPDSEGAAGLLERSRTEVQRTEARSRPLGPDEVLDPNTASADELDRLPGVGAATARSMVQARVADGPFRSPEDLMRVRGLGPASIARLVPHLNFGTVQTLARGRARTTSGVARGARLVDLNYADPAALQTLPGIGPALAQRIVTARAERPFGAIEDLQRVPGIGPATVTRLRALVTVGR